MNAAHQEVEAREFRTLKLEVEEAVEAHDAMTASVALGELEGLWMCTEDAAMRIRVAAFLRQYAAHCDFVEFH